MVIVGRGQYGEDNLLISHWLLAHLLRRTGEALLNLKDLLAVVSADGRAPFSGFLRWLKRGEATLLIPQWLLAKWVRRTGEGLLNLKDLQTALSAED